MWAIAAALFFFQSSDFSSAGMKALEEGKYEAAVQAFTKAVEADAKDYSELLSFAAGAGQQISARAATFLAMDQEPSTSSDLPSASGGAAPRTGAEAGPGHAAAKLASELAPVATSRNGRDPSHMPSLAPTHPFEHGTDAQMIERRVRTVTPLVTPTPSPGASSNLRREVLYALRTGGPAAPDQVADLVGVHPRLRQHAPGLAPVEEDVVGPLQPRGHAGEVDDQLVLAPGTVLAKGLSSHRPGDRVRAGPVCANGPR